MGIVTERRNGDEEVVANFDDTEGYQCSITFNQEFETVEISTSNPDGLIALGYQDAMKIMNTVFNRIS